MTPANKPWETNVTRKRTGKLSLLEERELLRRVREGDATAENALVLAFDNFVGWFIRRYCGTAPSEDNMQDGRLGLLVAMRRYNPDLGTTFMSYAGYWVWHFVDRARVKASGGGIRVPCNPPLGDAAALQIARRRKISLDTRLRDQDGNAGGTLHDLLRSEDDSPEDIAAMSVMRNRFDFACKDLAPHERESVKSMFSGESYTDASVRNNISKEAARRRGLGAMAKVANKLGGKEAVKRVREAMKR